MKRHGFILKSLLLILIISVMMTLIFGCQKESKEIITAKTTTTAPVVDTTAPNEPEKTVPEPEEKKTLPFSGEPQPANLEEIDQHKEIIVDPDYGQDPEIEQAVNNSQSYLPDHATPPEESVNESVPVYEFLYFVRHFGSGQEHGLDYMNSGVYSTLRADMSMFPTKAARQSGNYYYTVYDLIDSENFLYETDQRMRAFVFYTNWEGQFGDNYQYPVGYTVYMLGTHYYDEFSSLKVGDNAEKVYEIDAAAKINLGAYMGMDDESIRIAKEEGLLHSVHLLADGVLQITYDWIDGEYVIDSFYYSPDFELNNILSASEDGFIYGDLCYQIDPLDYVVNSSLTE